jgi:hypothetical protein
MGYTDYYGGLTLTTDSTAAFSNTYYTIASGNSGVSYGTIGYSPPTSRDEEDDRTENEKWLDNRVEEICIKL